MSAGLATPENVKVFSNTHEGDDNKGDDCSSQSADDALHKEKTDGDEAIAITQPSHSVQRRLIYLFLSYSL